MTIKAEMRPVEVTSPVGNVEGLFHGYVSDNVGDTVALVEDHFGQLRAFRMGSIFTLRFLDRP